MMSLLSVHLRPLKIEIDAIDKVVAHTIKRPRKWKSSMAIFAA